MNLVSTLRLIRIGFLPLLTASSISMAIGIGNLYLVRPWSWPGCLVIIGNLGWILYGSLLNDACDWKSDLVNTSAGKVYVELNASHQRQWRIALGALAIPVILDLLVFLWLIKVDPKSAYLLFLPVSLIGLAMATGYSLPPFRARSRPFGATWTLMGFHPVCFFRVLAVNVESSHLFPLSSRLLEICFFLWACHGITTVAMKDIPDSFADKTDGIRSLPNIFPPTVSTVTTMAFIVITALVALITWHDGLLDPVFFVILIPLLTFYVFLALYLHRWFVRAKANKGMQHRTPRMLFHAVAYVGTWGMLIPAFMGHLRLP